MTDLRNVVVRGVRTGTATLHAWLHPDDMASQREASTFRGGILPARALAAYKTPWVMHIDAKVSAAPVVCDWEPTSVFFVRLYNAGNLCHLINELLLPLLALALPMATPREIYTFEIKGDPRANPLPIFSTIASKLAVRVANVEAFYRSLEQPLGRGGGGGDRSSSGSSSSSSSSSGSSSSGSASNRTAGHRLTQASMHDGGLRGPGRCLGSVTWGLGVKPMYNAFRVAELRRTIGSMRSMLFGGFGLPQAHVRPTTILIQRRGASARHRFIPDLAPLRRQIQIDELCCDFSRPLAEQLSHISRASVVLGLHGAGLANVMFAREGAILIEFKGWYGLTDYVYRKYVQAVYGGWVTLHIDEHRGRNAYGHVVTDEHAAVARFCLEDLQAGGAAKCRQMPFVMQASPVGHDWDCWFREWLPQGRPAAKATLCPSPSWIEPIQLPGQSGRTCWSVTGFGVLEQAPPPKPTARPAQQAAAPLGNASIMALPPTPPLPVSGLGPGPVVKTADAAQSAAARKAAVRAAAAEVAFAHRLGKGAAAMETTKAKAQHGRRREFARSMKAADEGGRRLTKMDEALPPRGGNANAARAARIEALRAKVRGLPPRVRIPVGELQRERLRAPEGERVQINRHPHKLPINPMLPAGADGGRGGIAHGGIQPKRSTPPHSVTPRPTPPVRPLPPVARMAKFAQRSEAKAAALGPAGCANRRVELNEALALCLDAQARGDVCDGVTRMTFAEMKHGAKCAGGAYHRLGKLPMEPYMGRMNGAQTWVHLKGGAARTCDLLDTLQIAAAAPPPPPPPPPRPPPSPQPPAPSNSSSTQQQQQQQQEEEANDVASDGIHDQQGGLRKRSDTALAEPPHTFPSQVVVPLPSGWEPPRRRSRSIEELQALTLLHDRERALALIAAANQTAPPLSTSPPAAAPAAASPAATPGAADAFASASVRPPRIFMYPNAKLSAFLASKSPQEAIDWAFGSDLGDGYRATDTWALAAMLVYKLHYLRPSWLTSHPEKADLFVIPMLPRRPTYGTSDTYGDDFRFETSPMCDQLYREDLSQAYPHLTLETAARHVVVAVDYTPLLAFCAMHPGGEYARQRPLSHRLLRRMRWLMHEEFGAPELPAPAPYYAAVPFAGMPNGGGLLINVPFPSAVHSAADLRRLSSSPRALLLSFAGSLKGSPTNRALRSLVGAQCRAVGEPACRIFEFAPGLDLGGAGIVAAFRMKRNSTFCAEPGGHNRIRKGIVDALANGCIPVTFLEPEELNRLWPYHLFGWRDRALINIRPSEALGPKWRDGGEVAAGSAVNATFNLVAHLRTIPQAQVLDMQRAIAAHGQRLAYLRDTSYDGEDATDILLKGLAFGLPGRR